MKRAAIIALFASGCAAGGSSSVIDRWSAHRVLDSTACVQPLSDGVWVVVNLATAETGEMLWSTRCMASSADYPDVENAIENAARCAASAFALNQ